MLKIANCRSSNLKVIGGTFLENNSFSVCLIYINKKVIWLFYFASLCIESYHLFKTAHSFPGRVL